MFAKSFQRCRKLVAPSQPRTEITTHAASAFSPEISRIESIDIFRGLTVLVMIFVDNLGFVNGLPWWTNHMPRDANGMTYVDMVFPAFLFLMGMSIPVAMRSRAAKGGSKSSLWANSVVRSMTLVVLGLFVANAPQVDARLTRISTTWWTILGFVAIGLVLYRYPNGHGRGTLYRILKYSGLALLVWLAVIFRTTTPAGQTAWLDFSDWEILGLLGWAYLSTSVIYLLFQKRTAVLASALAVLIAINVASVGGWLSWLNSLPLFLKPFEAGLSSIAMAGLLVSLFLVDNSIASTFRAKAGWTTSCAAIFFGTGWALRPFGISKLRDTPTWCLYSAAANTLIVLLLYWIADVKHLSRWARFTKPVGTNPLLSYFLPYVAYFVPKLERLTAGGTAGWPGILKSMFFTGLILVIVTVLGRANIKLRL